MNPLADALGGDLAISRADSVDEATDALIRIVRPGDAVLVKASNSVGLARLVERVAGGLACST
jgi:UDP-N-acetylmuramoyl-tripeptide--D-alanyl-D-alanine ligase